MAKFDLLEKQPFRKNSNNTVTMGMA